MRAATIGALLLIATAGCASGPFKLQSTQIVVDSANGPRKFEVEVASDPAAQRRGLMYRRELAPNAGMLFDFHTDAELSFWMKDTILPLDMLFIRADGTISSIAANAVPYSTTPIPSAEPVRAVLEINAGRAHDLGIRAGDKVHAAIFHNTD